jgi:hypothetical protein
MTSVGLDINRAIYCHEDGPLWWLESRKIYQVQFEGYQEVFAQVSTPRYPSWTLVKVSQFRSDLSSAPNHPLYQPVSKVLAQVKATAASYLQKAVVGQVHAIIFDATQTAAATRLHHSEGEERRLTQLISEAVNLTASLRDRYLLHVDSANRQNNWPDGYNLTFYSLAFGQPETSMPKGLTVGRAHP